MQMMNVDKQMEMCRLFMRLEQPLHRAFWALRKTDVECAGFGWPMHAVRESAVWLWLTWRQGGNMEQIRKTLGPSVKRSVEANMDPKAYQGGREDHDSFLIQLAILLGNRDLMKAVCDCVQEANPKCEEYQYLHAWTGILKYRILDKQKKVVEQHQIMQKWKPTRIFAWPSKKLVETFVNREYKAFHTVLKRSCEKYWRYAEKCGALTVEEDGTRTVNARRLHTHFYWPWVEGAFAKLAYLDGAEIKYDSPWLPLEFVKAIEKP